jgi:dynein heavy chain
MDSVRNTYLLHLLLMKQKHLLMVGATGTGKTINISQYLMGAAKVNRNEAIDPNCIPFTITFSAQTSANMTQDMIDAKLEKRRKGVFGPAAGKQFIIHVDDMNMPKRETYGAQPPIEILRSGTLACMSVLSVAYTACRLVVWILRARGEC